MTSTMDNKKEEMKKEIKNNTKEQYVKLDVKVNPNTTNNKPYSPGITGFTFNQVSKNISSVPEQVNEYIKNLTHQISVDANDAMGVTSIGPTKKPVEHNFGWIFRPFIKSDKPMPKTGGKKIRTYKKRKASNKRRKRKYRTTQKKK